MGYTSHEPPPGARTALSARTPPDALADKAVRAPADGRFMFPMRDSEIAAATHEPSRWSSSFNQSASGIVKFTSDFQATGAGSKTLTLAGTNESSGNVIAGAIVNNSAANTTALLKSGTGTWSLSGVNLYTGGTTVTQGVLQITGGSFIKETTCFARGQRHRYAVSVVFKKTSDVDRRTCVRFA